MASIGTGNQATSDIGSFLTLTIPTHLPPLTTNDPTATSLLPTGQLTTTSQLSGWSDIPPERQGVDFGQVDYFIYILNDVEVLTDLWLCVRLDGLNPGPGGELPRYAEDPICQAIDRITFVFGRDLQALETDAMHFGFLMNEDEQTFRRESQLRGYNVPVGERIDKAKGPKWYYLRIPFWWTLRNPDSWHQYALQRLTRIVIHWRSPNAILQQELANTQPTPMNGGQYIMDHFLRFRVTAITEATKQVFIRRMENLGPAGQLYLIEDNQRLHHQLQPGVHHHVIQLNTFTKYAYNLRFVLRAVSTLTPNFLDNDRYRTLPIEIASLNIAGRRFMNPTDYVWMTHAVDESLWKGNPEHAIYNIPFSDFPGMVASAVGGIDFSNASSPQLNITTQAFPEHVFLDCYLQCQNYVRLSIVGNQSGAEVVQPL